MPLKTSTHYKYYRDPKKTLISNQAPPRKARPNTHECHLNIWDARVHCAVLKLRTTHHDQHAYPPPHQHKPARRSAVRTRDDPYPSRPRPKEAHQPPGQPKLTSPVPANPFPAADCLRTQQCAHETQTPPPQRSHPDRRPKTTHQPPEGSSHPSKDEQPGVLTRPTRPEPHSQCSTHEQPPDARTTPQTVCLTPTHPKRQATHPKRGKKTGVSDAP